MRMRIGITITIRMRMRIRKRMKNPRSLKNTVMALMKAYDDL
jgi:hypothetical protein